MSKTQIVRQACENMLGFITHGNPKRVLRKQDEVLILGDYGDLIHKQEIVGL